MLLNAMPVKKLSYIRVERAVIPANSAHFYTEMDKVEAEELEGCFKSEDRGSMMQTLGEKLVSTRSAQALDSNN